MKTGDIVMGAGDGAGRTYTLGEMLGRGLWGTSWLVRDSAGREFVLKAALETSDLPADAPFPEGLIAACRAAVAEVADRLTHATVGFLPRLDGVVVSANGNPGLLLPRYPNTLKRRIAGGLPLSEAIAAMQRLAVLLEESGFVHGDLRPSNVFLNDRHEVVLADPLPNAIAAYRTRLVELAGPERDEHTPPEAAQTPNAGWDTFAIGLMLYRAAMISSGGTMRDPRREERIPLPKQGLDKVEIATLRDRVLARLKEDRANPRFSPRLAERFGSLLNRALSKDHDPSPPYRFTDAAALRPRIDEVAELVDPQVDDVGHLLLASSAKNGVFQGGDTATFSVTIACGPGVSGHEDVVCGLQLVDLDASGDGRIRLPDVKYGVKAHPSGRQRFDFTLPGVAPGRYRVNVAFSVKDGRAEPKVAQGEFEIRPPPGYVPPAEDPPSVPAPLSMPRRASPPPAEAPKHEFRDDPDRGSDSGADIFPLPLAPSSPGIEPPRAILHELDEPPDDHDTLQAPPNEPAIAVAVEIEETGAGGYSPPPPLLVMPTAKPILPANSPTLTPEANDRPSSPMDPPTRPSGPTWQRPVDHDDLGAGHDPFVPGPSGGEDLPSFGGERPSTATSSGLSSLVERAFEFVRRDTYTALMIFMGVALAGIFAIFLLNLLF